MKLRLKRRTSSSPSDYTAIMTGSGTSDDSERGAYLRQRNNLWRQLRQLEPNDKRADALLQELSSLTGWSRQKILDGLGWA